MVRVWWILIIALGLAFGQPPALGEELKVWTPKRGGPKLIIPVAESEEPSAAAERYLKALYASDALGPAMKTEWISEVTGTFSEFSPGAKPTVVLLDNNFDKNTAFVKVFEAAGADVYVVPLAAELAVRTAAERAVFRKQLATSVNGVVLLSGHDIAPKVYRSRVTYAFGYNHKRDEMEQNILKAFLDNGTAKIFGICRGQQMIGATLGYKLYQDVSAELGAEGHEEGRHGIEIVAGSILSDALGGKAEANVNSFHHQSVKISSHPRGPLKATAFVNDGEGEVVEAVESRSGRIFAVQFHPELMSGPVGKAVVRKMVEMAKEHRDDGCHRRLSRLGS